jgi:hypothetical protein
MTREEHIARHVELHTALPTSGITSGITRLMSDYEGSEPQESGRMHVAHEQAAKRGCRVVLPEKNELFVDIDGYMDHLCFEANIKRFQKIEPCTYEMRPSPSGKQYRFHVVVTLKRNVTSDTERVLLQTLLGSDRTREMISLQRIVTGQSHPTLFFEKKDEDELPLGNT